MRGEEEGGGHREETKLETRQQHTRRETGVQNKRLHYSEGESDKFNLRIALFQYPAF